MSTFQEIQQKALEIRNAYSKIEPKPWGVREHFLGLIKDVGDLSKILMVRDGYREDSEKNNNEALAHELSDVLWSILVLADELHIDLEKEFVKTTNQLEERINK